MEVSLCTSFCGQKFKGVVRHIGSVHAHHLNFCIWCGIDGCHRTYKKLISYKMHIYEKHNYKDNGAGLLQPEDMEVSSDDRQDGFDEDDSIFLYPTYVAANNQRQCLLCFTET